jgi:ferric iron reductase protein FhuF
MIDVLAASVPRSLKAQCAALTTCRRSRSRCSASSLREDGTFEAIIGAFSASYPGSPRNALISLWSMYYLNSLITPAAAALLCLDHILPVGFDEIDLSFDANGFVSFAIHDGGVAGRNAEKRRFSRLVTEHIAPFVALCARHSGASPRIFWCNAAVILEYVATECARGTSFVPEVASELHDLLGGATYRSDLARPYREAKGCERTRRVCCLRYHLQGEAYCADICPQLAKA